MIRGTTAQFKFKIPYREEELTWVTIKFWQKGNTHPDLPITKKLSRKECYFPNDPTELYVSLTADETMRFSEKYKAQVQLRAQAKDGNIFGNRTKLVTVYPMNDDILDEDPTLPSENEEGWIVLDGETVGNE